MSLFNKDFLSKEVDNAVKAESLRLFPYERNTTNNDKTPFDLVIENKFKYFDQKSGQLKEIMKKARTLIAEKCFTSELNSTFPNEGKIAECVKEGEKEFRKLNYLRETHFANIFFKHSTDLDNCPTNNHDCIKTADQSLVWNAAKLPYFFAENY